MRRRLPSWSDALAVLVLLGGLVAFSVALERAFAASEGWGWDFGAYFDAARRLAATGTPYRIDTLTGPFQPGPPGLYLYPPPLALVLQPFTVLPEHTANFLWLMLHLALLALTGLLMPVQPRVRIAAAAVAALTWPFLHDIELGNVSVLVTFLGVLAWRHLDRPLGSVALTVSIFLRPTMAWMMGWWLLRGQFRPFAWALLAVIAIAFVTLPFIGLSPWFDFLLVVRNATDLLGQSSNIDLGSTALRLMPDAPDWAPTAALLGGYAIAIGAVLLSLRRDRELSFVVTLMATLVLSPWMHDLHLTHLIVPAAFLASRGHWWGFALPFIAYLPVVRLLPLTYLSFLALAGLLLPFLAPDRGDPAGSFLDQLRRRRLTGSLQPAQQSAD